MLNPIAFVPDSMITAGKCTCGIIEGGGFGKCQCGAWAGAGRPPKN